MLHFISFLTLAFAGRNRDSRNGVEIFPGYITHGINNFNGELLVDLGEYSQLFPVAEYEIGVLNESPDATDSEFIVESTDRARLVATTGDFHEYINEPVGNTSFLNIPITEVGAFFFGTNALNKRARIVNINDAAPGQGYRQIGTPDVITIGNWDSAAGQATIESNRDGTVNIEISICGGLPKGVYTVWEVGAENSNGPNEALYAIPASGLPNIIVTDEYGNGNLQFIKLNNPVDNCVEGDICALYYSIFYHFEYSVYGFSPALTFLGYGPGIIGSNHLWIPLRGNVLVEPISDYDECVEEQSDDSESNESKGRNPRRRFGN